MRAALIIIVVLSLIGCRSVRKVSETYVQKQDSVTITRTETVTFDTVTVQGDTAVMTAQLTTEGGEVHVGEVVTEQGERISISYEVRPKPGGAEVKIKAVAKPVEVVQQTTVIETEKITVDRDKAVIVQEKRVRTGALVHLWWIIPLALVAFIIYKKWPLIKSFINI
jgi:hypothetical protein